MSVTAASNVVKLFSVIFIFSTYVEALNMELAMEGSCSEMRNETTTDFIDQNWIQSTPRWYLVFANKFTIYRATLHHFDEDEEMFASIRDYQLYYESCLMYDTPENGVGGRAVTTGYEPGLQSYYNLVQVAPGVYDFFPVSFNETNPRNFSRSVDGAGRHYVSLTDNESFMVYTSCYWGPDQMSFAVLAVRPTLPENTMQCVREHVVSQGFHPRYFAELKFDSCKPSVLNQLSPWASTSTMATT